MRHRNIFIKVSWWVALLLVGLWSHSWADESVQFETGFNLFSYPVAAPVDYSAYDLIQDLNSMGELASIQRFSPKAGRFETCVWDNGEAAGVDFAITNQEGYIVHVSGSVFGYSFTGDRTCQSVTLKKGFNLSIFPCPESNYTSLALLSDLGSDTIISIKHYDHTTTAMETSFWDSGTPAGADFDILHTEAYLVEMFQETTWTPVSAPLPPQNVTAFSGNAQVILTWDKPDGMILGYNVYRSTNPGGAYVKLNFFLETQTDYTDESVSNGSTYYYVVTAVNQYSDESSDSDEVSGTPTENDPTIIDTNITSNTTWNLANSPYIVTTSIQVTNGNSLMIEPGVEIKFDGGHLEVEGILTTIGTSSNPIFFRSSNPSPVIGDWTGIRFIGSGSSGSQLEYCRIEHAERGVYAEDSSPEISHCIIVGEPMDSGTYYGIYLRRSNSYIHDCNISNFENDTAILMWESSPLVEYNTISNNERGIHIYYDGTPQILNNTIEDYRERGIFCDGEYRTTNAPFPVINNNTIRTIYNYS